MSEFHGTIMGKASKNPIIYRFKKINLYFPLPGKSDHSQPRTLKWENVDDTPLGNIETD